MENGQSWLASPVLVWWSAYRRDLDGVSLCVAAVEGNARLGGVLLQLIEGSCPVNHKQLV